MCYYTQSHVYCGHDEKLPVEASQCSCALNEKTKITDTVNATENGLGESEKKNHGKRGNFKGEVKPVKESWCPKCLVQQKAGVMDQFAIGNLGRVLSKAINPGAPQIHPVKIHAKMPKSSEEKAEEEGEEEQEGVAGYVAGYQIPNWGTQWEDKTRSDMKREIREGKMEMIDQIRILRDIVKANGIMTTNELEQRIQAQTDERKAAEQKKKDDAENERQEKIAKIEAEVDARRVQKATEKADRIRDHLERMALRKARVLYRV